MGGSDSPGDLENHPQRLHTLQQQNNATPRWIPMLPPPPSMSLQLRHTRPNGNASLGTLHCCFCHHQIVGLISAGCGTCILSVLQRPQLILPLLTGD